MYFKQIFYPLVALFFLNGCVEDASTGNLLSYNSTIKMSDINGVLAKAFPISKKTAVGSLVFQRGLLRPGSTSSKLALSVSFNIKSFAIPEGIEGVLSLSAGLRYDPQSKKLFLTELTPIGATYANAALAKYVSKDVQSAIRVIAIEELNDIEVHQMQDTFTARFVKKISVSNGKIDVMYAL